MIHTSDDTICAISTPHGIGGIAVIRLSGPEALNIADQLWRGKSLAEAKSHTAHLGTIIDPATGEPLDQGVATVFRAPHSYTGQHTVEFSVHGSEWVQTQLLHLLINSGARMAEPGEFTRRAFAAGQLDLAQAEGVADLIASNSRAAHRIAINQMRGGFSKRLNTLREQLLQLASLLELELDFSEEEVEFASRTQLLETAQQIHQEVTRLSDSFSRGAAIKEGIPVAIAGVTNAGKSSLLNALLGEERAIVSNIHGTTRDTVEDILTLGDYRFRIIDTAGMRSTTDTIERLGIDRSHRAIQQARIVIAVVDTNHPLDPQLQTALQSLTPDTHVIVALNKTDLNPDTPTPTTNWPIVKIAAKNHHGIDQLQQTIINTAKQICGNDAEQLLITNARHAEALTAAAQSVSRVIDGLTTGLSGDFIAQDLRETLHILGTITGTITTPDILASIFTRFCIGK